jgi:hypothetical protein
MFDSRKGKQNFLISSSCIFQRIYIGSTAHPTSYQTDARVLSAGVNRQMCEGDHLLQSSA